LFVEPIAKTVRGLTDKRATLEFPSRKDSLDDVERGALLLDMATCVSCSACEQVCPAKAIDMVDVKSGAGASKKMPQVGMDRCMLCGFCEEVCPTKCLTLTKGYDFEVRDKRALTKRPEELRG
jgi:hydrogenase-4 component H